MYSIAFQNEERKEKCNRKTGELKLKTLVVTQSR